MHNPAAHMWTGYKFVLERLLESWHPLWFIILSVKSTFLVTCQNSNSQVWQKVRLLPCHWQLLLLHLLHFLHSLLHLRYPVESKWHRLTWALPHCTKDKYNEVHKMILLRSGSFCGEKSWKAHWITKLETSVYSFSYFILALLPQWFKILPKYCKNQEMSELAIIIIYLISLWCFLRGLSVCGDQWQLMLLH